MMDEFAHILLKWYREHHRELPWRNTKDPYKIWLSEIILQQTRVEQGLPYYNRFIETFPSVSTLALAEEDQILKLWQGLGYYSRARNLHKAAILVHDKYKGEFPKTYRELLDLPGVGPYTAAAIGSFAFDLPEPVMDGNVQRVIARLFAIEHPFQNSRGKSEFMEALHSVFNRKEPALFNQAIMEFGALQCVPKSPGCPYCPAQFKCLALAQGRVQELPVKKVKNPVRVRYLNYFIPVYMDQTLLEKRTGEGIWRNLYQFPLHESTDDGNWSTGTNGLENALGLTTRDLPNVRITGESHMTHLLSHQRLEIRFVTLQLNAAVTVDTNRFIPTPLNRILSNFAIPRIIEKFVMNAGW